MSMTAKIVIKPPSDPEVWAPCRLCRQSTRHRVITNVEKTDTFNGTEHVAHFQTIECRGCTSLSLVFRWKPITAKEWFTEIYPKVLRDRGSLPSVKALPTEVSKIYLETLAALSNDAPVLAGIGLRATVEAVCKDKKAAGSNLQLQIDNLVAQGVITADAAQILHSLRFMGNAAAHEMRAHTNEELITALDIVEMLLKNVYILPKFVEKLPQT